MQFMVSKKAIQTQQKSQISNKTWFRNRLVGSVLTLTAVLPLAVQAATIKVNTFNDENGEGVGCSLREAIQASIAKKSYGGCEAGQQYFIDTIQLEAGTYQLASQLVINSNQINSNRFRGLRIDGADSIDYTQKDRYTGKWGKREQPKTTIKAAANQRIFNSAGDRSTIALNNLILKGSGALTASSVADRKGGLIRAGNNIYLDNVFINNGIADEGGAIYLEGVTAGLEAKRTLFQGNTIAKAGGMGAVVSMSCFDNLNYTTRTVKFENSSVVNNGNSQAANVIHSCGIPVLDISGTTLAKNTATTSIINFLNSNKSLNDNAKLKATHLTVVQNTAPSVLDYGDVGKASITNSIIAFNSNLDCRYNDEAGINRNKYTTLTVANSLLVQTATKPQDRNLNSCQLSPLAGKATDNNIYITKSTPLAEVLFPLANYGLGILGYLPKDNKKLLISTSSNVLCGSPDVRGMVRYRNDYVVYNHAICDAGALQRGKLTAVSDLKISNEDYQKRVEQLQAAVDKKVIDSWSDEDKQYVANTKKQAEAFLAAYKLAFGYRHAVVDIFFNDIPNEQPASGNPASKIKLFPELVEKKTNQYMVSDRANYNVAVTALGSGNDAFDSKVNQVDLGNLINKNNVICQWNDKLQRVLVSRADNSITPSGEFDYCKYTLTSTDGSQVSSGYIQVSINNIAPVAKNDTVTLPYTSKTLVLDILANDNDDGDGPKRPANLAPFYTSYVLDKNQLPVLDSQGNPVVAQDSVNIKIKSPPSLGRLVFERSGSCPDNSATREEQTCYGGKLTYINNNVFSPFSDTFTYTVLDSNLAESNVATVTINNTEADKAGQSTPIIEGGGAMPKWVLMLLIAVTLMRLLPTVGDRWQR